MLTKELMKGGAYDAEQIAVDFAQGTIEAIVIAATAGTGEAALEALMKSPAFAGLKEAAESGVMGQVITKAAAGGIEGTIQGLPAGMAGAILNENTWKSGNPLAAILEAGGMASMQGGAMGAAMGAVHGRGERGAGGGAEPEGRAGTGAGDTSGPSPDAGPAPVDSGAPAGDVRAAGDEPLRGAAAPDDARPSEGGRQPAEDAAAKAPHAADATSTGGDEATTVADEEPTTVRKEAPSGTRDQAPPVSDEIVEIDMPDETVMQASETRDPAAAQEMYENSMKASPNRECAIYRNSETGEYIVIQGEETTVQVGGGEAPKEGGKQQRWKEILDGRPDVGRWELQAHSHPSTTPEGFVDPINQWPSGANGDMGVMAAESIASGEPRSSRIDYVTSEGPEHTDFGFDPTNEKPYWVDVPDGAGGRETKRFKTMESYHDYLENTIHAPSQGDIPPHMSGTNPHGANVEPTVPAAASKASATTDEVYERIQQLRDKYPSPKDPNAMEREITKLRALAREDPAAAMDRLDSLDELIASRTEPKPDVEGDWARSAEDDLPKTSDEARDPELREVDKPNQDTRRSGSASAEGEARLAELGNPRPEGHSTHHIVPESEPMGEISRQIIDEAGIKPRTDDRNLQHQPQDQLRRPTAGESETQHATEHTKEYYAEVTRRLAEARVEGGSAGVEAELARIESELANGKFKTGPPIRGTYADWLVANRDLFPWMDDAQFEAVVEKQRGRR
jgi:hypothetical protein